MKRSLHRAVLAAAVFGVLATAATSARAQGFGAYEFQPRLYVGAGIGYNYLLNNSQFGVPGESDTVIASQSGFDWTLYAGMRFSPWIAAEIGWDAIYHPSDGYNYAMIDGVRAAGRIYFPTGYNLFPFIRLGIGYYFYGDEFEIDTHGVGFSAGVGATYQFHEILEMDIQLLYRAWYFAGMNPASSFHEATTCESGRWCPFGDEYMQSVNVQLDFRWNSWLFAW